MGRCLVPLVAALAGCLLGRLALGRPPSRARRAPAWDGDGGDGGDRDRDDGWFAPHPEPIADPYHQWNDNSNQQNLGMGPMGTNLDLDNVELLE